MSPSPGSLNTVAVSWTQWDRVRSDWAELWRQASVRTVFTSVQWIETWLEIFGPGLQPTLFQVRDANGPVACFMLVSTSERQKGLPVRRLYLNAAGEGPAHDTCLEYNDLLCRRGSEEAAAAAVQAQISRRRWDEFMLAGAVDSAAIRALAGICAPAANRTTAKPARYVNLVELRERGTEYEATLSSNTRAQLRRSRSLYEQAGAVAIQIAADVATAHEYLDELIAMHQRRWQSVGEPGAFNSAQFTRFHRRLIDRLWPDGAVHLVRVRAGDRTIGVLYNFVVDGCVAFYQSGFAYDSDNRLKPGLVTHAEAIRYYLAQGFAEYDLLAGASRYKQSLAKHSRDLRWTVHERRGVKMAMYRWIRSLKRRVLHATPAMPVQGTPVLGSPAELGSRPR